MYLLAFDWDERGLGGSKNEPVTYTVFFGAQNSSYSSDGRCSSGASSREKLVGPAQLSACPPRTRGPGPVARLRVWAPLFSDVRFAASRWHGRRRFSRGDPHGAFTRAEPAASLNSRSVFDGESRCLAAYNERRRLWGRCVAGIHREDGPVRHGRNVPTDTGSK